MNSNRLSTGNPSTLSFLDVQNNSKQNLPSTNLNGMVQDVRDAIIPKSLILTQPISVDLINKVSDLKNKPTLSIRTHSGFPVLTPEENKAYDEMIKRCGEGGFQTTLLDVLGLEMYCSFESLLGSMTNGVEKENANQFYKDFLLNYGSIYSSIRYMLHNIPDLDQLYFQGKAENRYKVFPDPGQLGTLSVKHIKSLSNTIKHLTDRLAKFPGRVREINKQFSHLEKIWSIYAKLLTSDQSPQILLGGWSTFKESTIFDKEQEAGHEMMVVYSKFTQSIVKNYGYNTDTKIIQFLTDIVNLKKTLPLKEIECFHKNFFAAISQLYDNYLQHLQKAASIYNPGTAISPIKAAWEFRNCQISLISLYWCIDIHHGFYDRIVATRLPEQFYPTHFYLSRIFTLVSSIRTELLLRPEDSIPPNQEKLDDSNKDPIVLDFLKQITGPLNKMKSEILKELDPNELANLVEFTSNGEAMIVNYSWDTIDVFRGLIFLHEHTNKIETIVAGYKKLHVELLQWIEKKSLNSPLGEADWTELKIQFLDEFEEQSNFLICFVMILIDVRTFSSGKIKTPNTDLIPEAMYNAIYLEGFDEVIEAFSIQKPLEELPTLSKPLVAPTESLVVQTPLQTKPIKLKPNETPSQPQKKVALQSPSKQEPMKISKRTELQLPPKREFIQIQESKKIMELLKKFGFEKKTIGKGKAGKGSHTFLVNPNTHAHTTVPQHPAKGTVKAIYEQAFNSGIEDKEAFS